jgi:hypothetical protein
VEEKAGHNIVAWDNQISLFASSTPLYQQQQPAMYQQPTNQHYHLQQYDMQQPSSDQPHPSAMNAPAYRLGQPFVPWTSALLSQQPIFP